MITNEITYKQENPKKDYYSIKSRRNHTTSGIESKFRQAMQSAGIQYSGEIVPDGRLHRFHIEGHKHGTLNGAYTLHFDGYPAGWFMDYKSGISQTWKKSSGIRVSYSLLKHIKEAKLQLEIEVRQRNDLAAEKAKYIWSQSKPITQLIDHRYLANKHIQPNGAKLYHDALIIPLYNASNQLVNLQFIDNDGNKKFLSGGRKRDCFNTLGDISERILICEGFATGASLHEDSGQCVVIAFDAGNLLPVAKIVRKLSPDLEIIICGDNDISGIGQIKAREAALAIGGKVLIPPLPGMDWNDVLKGDLPNG